jgi:hypothetical protein
MASTARPAAAGASVAAGAAASAGASAGLEQAATASEMDRASSSLWVVFMEISVVVDALADCRNATLRGEG